MIGQYTVIDGCRSCGSTDLSEVLDLGAMPLADALVDPTAEGEEPHFPLSVWFCSDCTLVQIRESVPPEVLFGADYPYYSSFSDALLDHSRSNVTDLIARCGLDESSLAVEIASNDGYLLQYFRDAGVPVLGIDPAPGPAEAARRRGIPTRGGFFGTELARTLVEEGVAAHVVVANNVLAHVPDQNDFVSGIATVLANDGLVSVEVPYVVDLVDGVEFDTIYHEHQCYFSVESARRLFERHGLFLNDLERLSIHGGTLRLRFQKNRLPSDAVEMVLAEERARGAHSFAFYADFGHRVEGVRRDLTALVDGLKSDGATVAAYGAAAKGATLLNYTGIGTDRLDFVVDRNHHKQGRLMPGVGLRIEAPNRLTETMPDYVLMLAWNFADEIMAQQQAYLAAGGRFILPVPSPRIVP